MADSPYLSPNGPETKQPVNVDAPMIVFVLLGVAGLVVVNVVQMPWFSPSTWTGIIAGIVAGACGAWISFQRSKAKP